MRKATGPLQIRLRLNEENRPAMTDADIVRMFIDTRDSESTKRAYREYIGQCLAFVGVPLSELTAPLLASWRAAVCRGSQTPNTKSLKLVAMRSLLKWSWKLGFSSVCPEVIGVVLKGPRVHVVKPYSVLTERELLAILEAAGTARNRALLALMVGAGLRVSEVAKLEIGDILVEDSGRSVHIRETKFGKTRKVPIGGDLAFLLGQYLGDRRIGPVFLANDRAKKSRKGDDHVGMTTRAIAHVVKKASRQAAIGQSISCHSLRHTASMRWLRAGVQESIIDKLLGHGPRGASAPYLNHLEPRDLRQAILPLPGGEILAESAPFSAPNDAPARNRAKSNLEPED